MAYRSAMQQIHPFGSYLCEGEGMVKGVVIGPLLAAFLGIALTGSETVGAISFAVALVVALLALAGQFKR